MFLEAFCFRAVCPILCVCVIIHWQLFKCTILINCINSLWEFHQMYHFDAFGEKDELIRFWGEKIKGQDHSKITGVLISTLGAFSQLYFIATCHNYSLPGPHYAVMSSRSLTYGFIDQACGHHFLKNAFSR